MGRKGRGIRSAMARRLPGQGLGQWMAGAVVQHGDQGHHQGEQSNQATDQGRSQCQTFDFLAPVQGDPWRHAAIVGGQAIGEGQVIEFSRIGNWNRVRSIDLG